MMMIFVSFCNYLRERSWHLLSLFLFLAVLAFSYGGTSATLDEGLSDYYLSLAKTFFDTGESDQFEQALKLAGEFDRQSVDYYVLQAQAFLLAGRYQEALMHYQKAELFFDQQKLYSLGEIREAMYPLFYRMRDYDELMRRYQSARQDDFSANQLFYTSLAFALQDKTEDLGRILQVAMKLYPYDPRFYATVFTSPNFVGKYQAGFNLLSQRDYAGKKTFVMTSFDQGIFLAMIERMQDDDLRRQVLDSSFAWLGQNINYKRFSDQKDIFLPDDKEDHELYQDMRYMTTEMLADTLPDAKIGYDTDRDGIIDQHGFVNHGYGIWYNDSQQTGRARYVFHIKDHHIVAVREQRDDLILLWQFSFYPTVEQVRVTHFFEDGRKREIVYQIAPQALVLAQQNVLSIDSVSALLDVTSSLSMPTLREILEHSWQVDDYLDAQLWRRVEIVDTYNFRVFTDVDHVGKFDHVVVYQEGMLVYGLRDMNKDGAFDVYERYKEGIFQGLAYSPVSGKSASYYEEYYPKGLVKIKLWLFDAGDQVSSFIRYDEMGKIEEVETRLDDKMSMKELIDWKAWLGN